MEKEKQSGKKTYTAPVLTEYGSLEKLTLGLIGNAVADADGGSMICL